MSFLAPAALVGLSLLAIPIVIHLLRPRKMRPTPFSSLRWLRETPQRASRRIQWHQWPLLLLRAGIITLLVLALAKPLLDFSSARQGVDRVVLMDASTTMGRQVADEPTPFDLAKQHVLDIAAQGRAGDRTTVLLVGAQPRVVLPATLGPVFQIPALASAHPEGAAANLAQALPLVEMLLGEKPSSRQRELIFVTDNLQSRWSTGEIQTFAKAHGPALAVNVIDVSPVERANAWIADARVTPPTADAEGTLRVVVRVVGAAHAQRRLRWSGAGAATSQEQAISLSDSGVAQVEFHIPRGEKLTAAAGELRLEPPDALAADDLFYVTLDPPQQLRLLLVEPETGVAGRRAGTHWRSAIAALANGGLPVSTTVRLSRELTADDIQQSDLVVLAGVRQLSDGLVGALEKRVHQGAGVVVCLGPDVDIDFYNQKLHRPLQPGDGLLPTRVAQRSAPATRSDEPARLERLDWNHPLLAPLADPVQSDFADSQFDSSMSVASDVGPRDAVLAWFNDGVPAIVEHPCGAGRVLLFNMSADDAWTDLPRRKCFVPLVDRVIAYLTPADVRQAAFRVGEPLAVRLPHGASADRVSIIDPVGKKIPWASATSGGNSFAQVERPSQAGIYRASANGKPLTTFVVNADRADSSLIAADTQSLRQWWSPAALEVISASDNIPNGGSRAATWPLWPWLVLAAAALLLAEQLYVTRLCPRAAVPSPPLLVRVQPPATPPAA